MAPRTGDKRVVVPSLRGASAGVALALALGALGLGGCGGGSPDPAQTTSAAAGSSASTVAQADPRAGAASSAEAGSRQGSGAKGEKGDPPAPVHSSAAKHKHGPPIAQPKGSPEQAPTASEVAHATVVDINLTSPSLPPGSGIAPLAKDNSCAGKDQWPALSWSGVPAGTKELVLYAMNAEPVDGHLYVDWALGGLDPGLSGIEAAKLPKGAITATNSAGQRGYRVCPEASGVIMFALYALPRALAPRPGFEPVALRKRILDVSGDAGLLPVLYVQS